MTGGCSGISGHKSQAQKDANRDWFEYHSCTPSQQAVLDKFYKGSFLTQQSYSKICWNVWMNKTERTFLMETMISMATVPSFRPTSEALIRLGLFHDEAVYNAFSPRLLDVLYRPEIFLYALTLTRWGGPLLRLEEMGRLNFCAIYGPDYYGFSQRTDIFFNFDERRQRGHIHLTKLDRVLLEFARHIGEEEFLALYRAQVAHAEEFFPLPKEWDLLSLNSGLSERQFHSTSLAQYLQRYLPKHLMVLTQVTGDKPSEMVDGSLYRQAFPRQVFPPSCNLL